MSSRNERAQRGATATPQAPLPAGSVATTLSVSVSITETVAATPLAVSSRRPSFVWPRPQGLPATGMWPVSRFVAASIRPDGSNAAEGALTRVGPRAMVGTAVVRGLPGRVIKVELPHRVELYSLNGGRITLDNVVSDLPSLPKLDAAGRMTFRFGGRVRISGDADGDYRGDMPITVEYQ